MLWGAFGVTFHLEMSFCFSDPIIYTVSVDPSEAEEVGFDFLLNYFSPTLLFFIATLLSFPHRSGQNDIVLFIVIGPFALKVTSLRLPILFSCH